MLTGRAWGDTFADRTSKKYPGGTMKLFLAARAGAAGIAASAPALPTSGPAENGSPAWFLQIPEPAKPTPPKPGPKPSVVQNGSNMPLCVHSTVCDPLHGASANRGQ